MYLLDNRSLSTKKLWRKYWWNYSIGTYDFDLICVYRKYIQVMSEIIGEDTCDTFTYINLMWRDQSLVSNKHFYTAQFSFSQSKVLATGFGVWKEGYIWHPF